MDVVDLTVAAFLIITLIMAVFEFFTYGGL